MSWGGVLTLGTKYFQKLRKLPVIFLKQPRIFLLPKYFVPYPRVTSNFGRLSKYISSYSQSNSLVRSVYRKIINSSTQQRPNSLLRVYRGFAGSVQLRHYVSSRPDCSFRPINDICKPKHESWFSNIFGTNKYRALPDLITNSVDSINPKEFIAAGCNSAVWAAEVRQESNNEIIDKLAVKVLYNYYVNSSYDEQANLSNDVNSLQNIPENWILLHRQIQRECELRPRTNHPNIVPLVGHFIDRAPLINSVDDECIFSDNYSESSNILSSSKALKSTHETVQSKRCWPCIKYFSEGFDNRPYTFYMLMPRFEGTLDNLLRGDLKLDLEKTSTKVHRNNVFKFERNLCSDINVSQIGRFQKAIVSDFTPSSESHAESHSLSSNLSLSNSAYIKHGEICLPMEDIVAILAQIFEAIAELEIHGIAHRDIKPNNILIRQRVPFHNNTQNANINNCTQSHCAFYLNDEKSQMANSRFHVALTDFGCAIRTRHVNHASLTDRWKSNGFLSDFINIHHYDIDDNNNEYLNHSGNLALLAPEIAQIVYSSTNDPNNLNIITNKDYAHSDLWAAATLIYPLFGIPNPFIDGTLSSVNYTEDSLPVLPNEAPKIMTWILHQCLKRNPSERPNADEVADILHTWCLIQHFHNKQEADILKDLFQPSIDPITMNIDILSVEFNKLTQPHKIEQHEFIDRLRNLLNICWASDWLSGAARPPHGIRSLFYSRATPGRLSLCLNVVHQLECFNI
ncbi:Serine/threonine-protein kinase PINK1, mitochondrial [Schistosoma japonicum]|nr:Serine/threonine-protein kinase PINK1, mitochondrial [Schistosoma japonicum]KAH8862601.1 Serine/threonine-protein kinase PINK1, mitochondrial [Schistosoma japonicum]KAH8862602.1 Serine/threonine-protein kinase PINK1, mitochondrial [Schistosoma japonicum]